MQQSPQEQFNQRRQAHWDKVAKKLEGWTGLGKTDLPENVFLTGDSPHGTLFPRLAGIVHHGGCGTTHTAARSGIPQFILPQIADQYYWGHRIHSLGMGPKPVAPKRLTDRKLTIALRDMVENSTYQWHAKAFASKTKFRDGTRGTVDTIVSNVKLTHANRTDAKKIASLSN